MLASTGAQAGDDDVATAGIARAPELGAAETSASRAEIRRLVDSETGKANLPADLADAVIFVESGYNSSVVGSVGEVGLMQVRPETAAMLGFRGTAEELAKPDINVHYGVLYLSRAWRLSGGDLCRTLMKYRAGHGEESMTPRSQVYCNRARNHLLAMNSPVVTGATIAPPPAPAPVEATVAATATTSVARSPKGPSRPKEVYMRFRQGTAAASRAYWAAHEVRIRVIKARIEAKWQKVAAR
ncbi:transglycosylase SLT domain-containing protein [Bradyrhizobium sp. BR 10289]|uniref:lytic transglycosylase domain-containing protein n=1 Tax=Bradyrhizobium sp. BR 10289 TaxID=2749993 RepID=UPI0032DE8378